MVAPDIEVGAERRLSRWHGGWRAEALQRADSLKATVGDLDSDGSLDEIVRRVDAASRVAGTVDNPLSAWMFGGEVEHAWALLHDAEESLVGHEGVPVGWVIDMAEHHRDDLDSKDPSVLEFDKVRRALDVAAGQAAADPAVVGRAEASARVSARCLVHNAHEASAAREVRARAWRNRLFGASGATVVIAALLLVFQAQLPNSPFISAPAGTGLSGWQVMAVTMVGGLLGGLLGGLRILVSQTRGRLSLTTARALQRTTLGAFTGFAGVLLITAGWLTTGSITSMATLLALAIGFGFSQELVGRALDKKMGDLIKS